MMDTSFCDFAAFLCKFPHYKIDKSNRFEPAIVPAVGLKSGYTVATVGSGCVLESLCPPPARHRSKNLCFFKLFNLKKDQKTFKPRDVIRVMLEIC